LEGSKTERMRRRKGKARMRVRMVVVSMAGVVFLW